MTQPLPSVEASVLSWREWWKRNEWKYTLERKPGATAGTGGLGGAAADRLVGSALKWLEDPYWDVRGSAALVLGKLGQNTAQVRAALLRAFYDRNLAVRQSAALALGMIRASEAASDLATILRDKKVAPSLRAFAAAALGLIGEPANLPLLLNVLHSPDAKDEVKAGAILGIGLLGGEQGEQALLAMLLGNEEEELQSFAVAALARMVDGEIRVGAGRRLRTIDPVGIFEKKLVAKETPAQVRRACALALGTIGTQETSIRALEQAYPIDRDRGVKGFSLIALAQLAARLPRGDADKAAARDFLCGAVKKEADGVVQGFAVLAAGLSCDEDAGALLLEIFNTGGRDPDVRAAAAIGLGILRQASAIPYLAQEITKPRDGGDARGNSAIALGMIGDPAAAEYLMAVLKDVNVPYLTWATSTGLGIMGHAPALSAVLPLLDDPKGITRESAIRSLGYFREEAAIEPLLDQFQKEKNDPIRATIVFTLGGIAEGRGGVPALARVAQDVNWMAAVKMPAIDLLTRLK